MNIQEDIKKILEISVNAPSGHNSQPWKFIVRDNSVSIYNIPDKDKILFNWEQRGSLVAHGALIENIAIVAQEKGVEANIALLPHEQDPNLTAKISFKKSGKDYPGKNLFSFIFKRATNRKPYKTISLLTKDRNTLFEFNRSTEDTAYQIFLTENREEIGQLAGSFSMGDKLIFENFYVHKALFDNVNWTLKEEREKREGLYVKTKELSILDRIILKYLFSNWNIVRKLAKVNLSTKAAAKREKLYRQCSAIGLIVAPRDSPLDFVESGRILQRFWLIVTSLGLSFQPISVGLLYLGQRCQKENPEELTLSQREFVREAYRKILDIFKIEDKTPTFSFRIGYSEPPTAASLKKSPDIIYTLPST